MEQEQKFDKELFEIIKRANVSQPLLQEDLEKLKKEVKESIEFLKLIDEIKLPRDKYVIYNDGDEQLIYENGEFFIQSATDSSKKRKKVKRLEAKDMYMEYIIKYILNPIIKKKESIKGKDKSITPLDNYKEKVNKSKELIEEKRSKSEKVKSTEPKII